jgi:DedD protein
VLVSSNSRSTAKNKVNNDPVDELKRRSRRRLVGSIALFLAAIIIVPALVENEEAQTGSEVELVVPTRPSAELAAPPAQVAPEAKLEASQSRQERAVAVAPVAPPVEPPPIVAEPKPETKPEPKVEPKPEPKVEPKPEPKVEPKPEPKVEPKPEPKVEPKPEPKVEPKTESKSEPKSSSEDPIANFAKAESKKVETYWIQVAAVSDKARADSLAKEIAGKGFPARVESANASGGTVYRVRVGPISGQAKADETKAKLGAAGYTTGRVVQ